MNEQTRTLNGLTILAGVWLVLAPFILSYSSSVNAWQEFILGIAVVIFGFMRLTMPRIAWPSWTNTLIGIWIIAAPWIMTGTTPRGRLNEFITGAIVAILGYASAVSTEHRQHMAHQ
jgi:peptidoglycan/LPS O-acetylase OafA/YrhL